MTRFDVRQEPDGQFAAYVDGDYVWGSSSDDEDGPLDDLFPAFAWPGGYPVVYITDGELICSDCAKSAYVEARDEARKEQEAVDADPASDEWTSTYYRDELARFRDDDVFTLAIESQPRSSGEYCEVHDGYIPGCEPHCDECARELTDDLVRSPLFHDSSGEHTICAGCMAKKVVDGEAVKTGKLAYTIPLNEWLGGYYDGDGW